MYLSVALDFLFLQEKARIFQQCYYCALLVIVTYLNLGEVCAMKYETIKDVQSEFTKIVDNEMQLSDKMILACNRAAFIGWQQANLDSLYIDYVLNCYENAYAVEVCKSAELIRHEARIRSLQNLLKSTEQFEVFKSHSQYDSTIKAIVSFFTLRVTLRGLVFTQAIAKSTLGLIKELIGRTVRIRKLYEKLRTQMRKDDVILARNPEIEFLRSEGDRRLSHQEEALDVFHRSCLNVIQHANESNYKSMLSELLEYLNKIDDLKSLEASLEQMTMLDENGARSVFIRG